METKKEPIQPFKVSDLQGKVPVTIKSKNKTLAEESKPSAGFPRVEALIEEYASAEEAKDTFSESISLLEAKLAEEKNFNKKKDIQKAKRAFELTLSVLDHLFKVKTEILTKA